MLASGADATLNRVDRYLFAAAVTLYGSSWFTGCAAYRPRPLNPPQLENQYRDRTLADTKLQSFIQANTGQQLVASRPEGLDLRILSLIGYYFSPDLEVARSQIAIADAGVRTAGARVNPTLGIDGGYNKNPESSLIYGILPAFTIEIAGKRGYRILQAESQAEAARIGLAEASWLLRSRIRTAFYNHLFSGRRRGLLQTEQAIRSEIVDIFDKRLAVGEAARPELDVYRVELITTQATLQVAIGDVAQTRSVLANAIGLPLSALEGSVIDTADFGSPPSESNLPIAKVQRAGLLHRADLRRLLADYAAIDAGLRLELARQYPDLVLTPGYTFEEGFARYLLSASLQSIPLFHRNQGRIAAAEAQRRQAGERFEALQSQAIGEMQSALVQYRAALDEWREASTRLVSVQRDREEAARRALAAGEGDRLGLTTVRLQTVTAARARLDALIRVQVALGALEDAMQQPLAAAQNFSSPPVVSPRKGATP